MTLDPAIVRRVQRRVGVPADGTFGPITLTAIDAALNGIDADVHRLTNAEPSAPAIIKPGPRFGETLAQLAEREVGVRESGGENRGPRIREYQSATWLAPGEWPWCAAFICWLIREAIRAHGTLRFTRPQTAGAWDFERWARERSAAGVRLIKPKAGELAQRGDIVVFTFSHIGLCTGMERNALVPTIEGNTNSDGAREGDGVYRKNRPAAKIRSLIRIG